jgi:GNAT superfamily N-acetyltransferase
VRVREARAGDAVALAQLFAQLGYPDGPTLIGARVEAVGAEPASTVLVADEDGALVGFVSASVIPLAHEDGSWCRIPALVVSSDRRRAGVGRTLVEAVECFARSRGCRYSEVTSGERPEREAAHRFYEPSATRKSRGATLGPHGRVQPGRAGVRHRRVPGG